MHSDVYLGSQLLPLEIEAVWTTLLHQLQQHVAATREPLEQGAPWVIDLHDLVKFMQTYATLASQAKATGSTSRGINSRLQQIAVDPIQPDGGRGALVKLADLFSAIK